MHHAKSFVLTGIFFIVFFSRCTYNSADELQNKYSITFRWTKAYESESWSNVRTGLIWSFSLLGAELSSGSFDASLNWVSENKFDCDFNKLGFNPQAMEAFAVIFEKIKYSEEYKTKHAIDIGRFLMLTLYSSNHYYKLTGAHSTINEFNNFHKNNSPTYYGVTNSGVSMNNRIIKINSSIAVNNLSCIASEGIGMLADSSFSEIEFECIDLMPNSQLRFSVYDKEGNLVSEANNKFSGAGKTGKCMWCHESNYNPSFYQQVDVPGYLSTTQFNDTINVFRNKIVDYRQTISTDVIYKNSKDHTQSELLYISFLEPSAGRIANEWNMSVVDVKNILKNFPTHVYAEFPFLGDLYYRSWVDSLAPYSVIKTPESARESCIYEPDFFK